MKLTGWLNNRQRTLHQIVVGDFNETPTGLAIEQMRHGYRSAFCEVHGYDPLATFPTALIQPLSDWSGCLDYIFLSPSVGPVQNAHIFCDKPDPTDDTLYPSDHVGLLAEIVMD
jgi:endonuclease/exonuclease/phosphatase family metal-dependent hydrolase